MGINAYKYVQMFKPLIVEKTSNTSSILLRKTIVVRCLSDLPYYTMKHKKDTTLYR